MTDKVSAATDAFVAAIWPEVEKLTQRRDGGAATAAMVVARPYIRAALSRVENVAPEVDKRTVPYSVSAMFWDIEDGEGEAELIAEADEETVYGLPAVLEKLATWLAEIHGGDEENEPEELDEDASAPAMLKRIRTLRTAVTRGKGTGAFRQYYTANGFKMLAHATVKRVSEDEEEN
jgi:hypothetical protein